MSANATAPPAIPVPLDLSTTFGALLIGFLFGSVLWGMQVIQTVWYYLKFPSDPITLKISVAVLNAVCTLDIILEFLSIWQGAIVNSGTLPNVFTNKYLFYRIPTFSVIAILCQGFFLLRIYKFATIKAIKFGVPLLLLPLMVFQLVGNSIVTFNWLNAIPGDNPAAVEIATQTKNQRYVIPLYAAACATDMVIAIVMCALLFVRRTGLGKTDRLLINLAATSINTGIWPALLALLICILTAVTSPAEFIFAAPNYAASALYVNTVLCNLNVRQFFRSQERGGSNSKKYQVSSLLPAQRSKMGGRGNTTGLPNVTIETAREHDVGVYELRAKNSDHSMTYDEETGSQTYNGANFENKAHKDQYAASSRRDYGF